MEHMKQLAPNYRWECENVESLLSNPLLGKMKSVQVVPTMTLGLNDFTEYYPISGYEYGSTAVLNMRMGAVTVPQGRYIIQDMSNFIAMGVTWDLVPESVARKGTAKCYLEIKYDHTQNPYASSSTNYGINAVITSIS